jgi:hypothetical protein
MMYPIPPTTPKPALCPHCGAPMVASVPAAPAPTMPAPSAPAVAPVKQHQSWRDREPLL